MPDPIRCSADPAHAHSFSCEPIVIGPEPDRAPPPAAAPPAAAPPPAPPAVAALVKRFVPHTREVQTAPVGAPDTATVLHCVGQEAALAILVLGSKVPILGMLGGVKAAFDLSVCVSNDQASRQRSANAHTAELACIDDGGTPIGMIDNRLTCLAPGVTP